MSDEADDTESEDTAEAAPEPEDSELPPSVPDDWLDQKPFDPAGR